MVSSWRYVASFSPVTPPQHPQKSDKNHIVKYFIDPISLYHTKIAKNNTLQLPRSFWFHKSWSWLSIQKFRDGEVRDDEDPCSEEMDKGQEVTKHIQEVMIQAQEIRCQFQDVLCQIQELVSWGANFIWWFWSHTESWRVCKTKINIISSGWVSFNIDETLL